MTVRGWGTATVVLWLAVGCAYYNGLYNANQLAGDARRAEREGRTGEARSLWAQAAVKAESVATRYPKSRHRDDALLLWGRGLHRIGDCRRAVRPLAVAVDSSPDTEIQHESRLLLADCRLALDDPAGAVFALDPLLSVDDSGIVTAARALRGQAELRAGSPERAADDLRQVPLAVGGIALARSYLALGRDAEAQETLERIPETDYDEAAWLGVLDELGSRSPERAAALVDGLVERWRLAHGERARLLLADGVRWSGWGEPERAAQRFRDVDAIAPDSEEGATARALLALANLRAVDDLDRLPGMLAELDAVGAAVGTVARDLQRARGALWRARDALRNADAAGRDVRLLMLGEVFRDSLMAPRPATQFFLRVASDHPTSPYAPKALLAAAQLQPRAADSIAGVLDERYSLSPYALALRSLGDTAFVLLEDSLRTAMLAERERLRTELGDEVSEREAGAPTERRRQDD